MLQKLSKYEVKDWLCWNLITLPPLQFCVKSHFGEFKRSKNVIYSNFRDAESCSDLLKLKFRTSRISKNNIFGPFEFAKMWFHVKSERQKNYQISTKWSLYFKFWKFLEHSVLSFIILPSNQVKGCMEKLSKNNFNENKTLC